MRGQKERAADWWLANIPDWGAVRIRQILEVLGSGQAVYDQVRQAAREHISPEAFLGELVRERMSRIRQNGTDGERWIITRENMANLMQAVPSYESAGEAYEKWLRSGGGFVTREDGAYPDRLRPYPDGPFALYYLGKLPEETRGTAAIVGARACSQYGRRYARSYARELAEKGVQIISGLAYGIDSEGHLGALESGIAGSTYAILGCGPDLCYPKEHEGIYRQILEQGGGVISEYAPGIQPLSLHFPMRNRIISGLSDCVLVMEARKKSGSLITVDLALDQGKEIFALPGRTGDALSEGCLQLIRHGAGVLTDCREVLEYLQGRQRMQDSERRTGNAFGSPNGKIKEAPGRSHAKEEAEKSGKGKAAGKAAGKAEKSRNGETVGKTEKSCNGETEKNGQERAVCLLDTGSDARKKVWDVLTAEEQNNMEGLLAETGLPLSAVQEAVLELLLEDRIEEVTVGYYIRKTCVLKNKNLRP